MSCAGVRGESLEVLDQAELQVSRVEGESFKPLQRLPDGSGPLACCVSDHRMDGANGLRTSLLARPTYATGSMLAHVGFSVVVTYADVRRDVKVCSVFASMSLQ